MNVTPRARTGEDCARRKATVANDLTAALFVTRLGMQRQEIIDFGLKRGCKHPAGSVKDKLVKVPTNLARGLAGC